MGILYTNRGHFYVPHTRPILIDCNFIVDPANGNGLGIRSLKGQGVRNVFMHTSSTPGVGNDGYVNPNPASGNILVQFRDNFTRYYGGFSGFIPPVSGTPILVASAGVTAGTAYTIVSVGTTTQAGWQSLGLPAGVIPNVGASFIASVTGTATGTGAVEVPASGYSGIDHIEVVGDPNQTIAPLGIAGSKNFGAWIVHAALFEGALTAPATNTVIGMEFYFGQSSVQVAGE